MLCKGKEQGHTTQLRCMLCRDNKKMSNIDPRKKIGDAKDKNCVESSKLTYFCSFARKSVTLMAKVGFFAQH